MTNNDAQAELIGYAAALGAEADRYFDLADAADDLGREGLLPSDISKITVKKAVDKAKDLAGQSNLLDTLANSVLWVNRMPAPEEIASPAAMEAISTAKKLLGQAMSAETAPAETVKPKPMTFKELRQSRKISQVELSALTGIHRTQIGRIETGTAKISNLSLHNAVALANCLGITAERLLMLDQG